MEKQEKCNKTSRKQILKDYNTEETWKSLTRYEVFHVYVFLGCQTSWRSEQQSALLYQNLPGEDQHLLAGRLVLLVLMADYIRAL